MAKYVEVTFDELDEKLILTLEEFEYSQNMLGGLIEDTLEYSTKQIDMTEEEYNNLGEFQS